MPGLIENFKRGDLLYGIDLQRKRAKPFLMQKIGAADVPVIIDLYNNRFLERLSQKEKFLTNELKSLEIAVITTKSLYAYFTDSDASKNVSMPEVDSGTNAIDLRPCIQAFSVETADINIDMMQHHIQSLLTPSYPKVSLRNAKFPSSDKKLDLDQRLRRRACKARLLDSTMVKHFILDGIDARHVFDREYSYAHKEECKPYDVACVYDSYTSAELRFVLKHLDEMDSHVKFYYFNSFEKNYVEIDLFAWLQLQSAEAKTALFAWAMDRNLKKKLSDSTLTKIKAILAPVKEEEAKVATPALSAKLPSWEEQSHLDFARSYPLGDKAESKPVTPYRRPPKTPNTKGGKTKSRLSGSPEGKSTGFEYKSSHRTLFVSPSSPKTPPSKTRFMIWGACSAGAGSLGVMTSAGTAGLFGAGSLAEAASSGGPESSAGAAAGSSSCGSAVSMDLDAPSTPPRRFGFGSLS